MCNFLRKSFGGIANSCRKNDLILGAAVENIFVDGLLSLEMPLEIENKSDNV